MNNGLVSSSHVCTPERDKNAYVNEVNRARFPNNDSPCVKEEFVYFLNEAIGNVPRGVSLSKMTENSRITKCRIVYQGEMETCTNVQDSDWVNEMWQRWNEKYQIKH